MRCSLVMDAVAEPTSGTSVLTVVGVVVGTLVALTLVVVLARLMARRAFRQAAELADRSLAGQERLREEPLANFLGVGSRGARQIRGAGMLVLTRDALEFFQAMTLDRVSIPRAALVEVSTPRSFLGKSLAVPLLRVDYALADGSRDSAAWFVRDLAGWCEALAPGSPKG